MKRIDKILNIILLVMGALYIIGRFAVPPEERQKILAESAKQEFSESKPAASSAQAETAVTGDAMAATGEVAAPQAFNAGDFKQIIAADSPTLVFTFASWCPYCKKLLPSIVAIAHERHPGLRIAAISVDESGEDLKKFLQLHPGLGFPVYHVANASQKSEYKSVLTDLGGAFDGGIPYTALYKGGRLLEEVHGAVAKSELDTLIGKYSPKSGSTGTGI